MTMENAFDFTGDIFMDAWRRQEAHWHNELVRYGFPDGKVDDVNDLHLRLCTHMFGEIEELVRCADWKIHSKGSLASKRTILQEIIDQQKFLFNMALLHGVTPTEFALAFHAKSFVVEQRVKLEVMRAKAEAGKLGPILVCDLDGVVCARDHALLAFANGLDRGSSEFTSTHEYRAVNGQKAYEELKRLFYESGGFLNCVVVKAAAHSLEEAYRVGVPTLVCTSRDIKRYPHLEYETHSWLSSNHVPYDAIVFSAEKERALTWIDRRSIAVDDEQEHVDKLTFVCEAVKYYMNDVLDMAVDSLREQRRALGFTADQSLDKVTGA